MKGQLKALHEYINKHVLKWRSKIEVVFNDGTKPYSREAEIVWNGTLIDVEGHYQQTIEELFEASNMRHYVITKVNAEVIGLNQIQDSDFSIDKSEAA